MKTIFVNTESKKYPIYISQGIIKQLYSFINKKCSQIIIISQDLVYNQCHGDIILNQLKNEGFSTNIILVENSESAKNIDNIKNVYNQMVQLDCNRNTLLIAYGGGVVGDITGFIASTFMRGIQYIQIPTTLLAMIDSSIGGKTGINFENIKNYIGTFYQPEKVIIDPNLTLTLSSRNKTAALGEIIKYAIIYDKSFFNKINLLIHNNQIFDMNYLKQIIYDCCLIKANIISKDEFDLKDRQYLNFGHTFAHAIESYLGLETVKHGEAVLMGMQFAVQLSYYLNLLNEKKFNQIMKLIKKVAFPNIKKMSFQKLFDFILKDKKNIDNKISFILLEDIGKPIKKDYIDYKSIRKVLADFEYSYY